MTRPEVSEGKTRWGRVNSLGSAGVNSVGRLWASGVVSGCLEPGPGVMKAEEYCLLEGMGQREEIWLWIGSFSSQSHAGPSSTFKNWLVQGRTVSSNQEGF